MRKIIAKALKWQAKIYITSSKAKVIVVTGSIGKTSTTQAIATVLARKYTIRKTLHNYNTDVGVPCSVFATELPKNVKNPLSWAVILVQNQFKLFKRSDVDIFVLELGTDSVGEIDQFKWLQPDVNIVTAIAPEHMEQFESIDIVAEEELSATHFSGRVLVNKHMVDDKFLKFADTSEIDSYDLSNVTALIREDELKIVGKHSMYALAAAVQAGRFMKLSEIEILEGIRSVEPQKGRMNKLCGIRGATLIDDTYNSSPYAVIAALDYLYETEAIQRIALLGNMNELGDMSEQEHIVIGNYCDPAKLDLVVTLGVDANIYTATAAKNKGCTVVTVETPYAAGEVIKNTMKENSLILLKGSQNGVFAEEATKLLLEDTGDQIHLVRQSNAWTKEKAKCFKGAR
jgi:UDP-N-acetylmuramoyl-tripeptide--D-alanyl-D-alanine ligase